MIRNWRMKNFVWVLALLSAQLIASNAFAACASPAGNAGDIVYSSTSSIMVYCNGTSWVGMGANSAVGFGTLTAGSFCTASGSSAVSCSTAAINLSTQVTGALPVGNLPGLASASLWVGNVSGAAAAVALSGDCTISNAGAITCTKINGSTVNSLATTPIVGTPTSTTFLRGDYSWATLPVTSSTAGQVAYYASTGAAVIGTSSLVVSGGSVGIGTAVPTAKLSVQGEVQVNSTSLICSTSTVGSLRYSGSKLQVCE